ncbi:MAG TPA: hypothetical protein VLF69_04480 [Candidatus Saccharimonadales bacterium]|nr:hypothetical protein [Candidatus Saccharimonadales bacterium]
MVKVDKSVKVINQHGPTGFVLLLAYIGAAVYFVQQSAGFWGFVWALIKALAWPAILVHHLLGT